MVLLGNVLQTVVEFVHRAKEEGAGDVDHAGGVENGRFADVIAQAVAVDGGEGDVDAAAPGDVENGGVDDAEDDGDGEIENDGREHRDEELADGGLEAVGEDVADACPVVHAPGGDHQDARERGERQARHDAAEQEHGGEQKDGVEHARQARLLTGFNGNAGAGDGRGGGHAAEEGQEDIADALRDELLIGVEGLAFHAGGGRAAQQALDHAEGGDGDDGGDEV